MSCRLNGDSSTATDGNNPLGSQVAHFETSARRTPAGRGVYIRRLSSSCDPTPGFFSPPFSQLTVAKQTRHEDTLRPRRNVHPGVGMFLPQSRTWAAAITALFVCRPPSQNTPRAFFRTGGRRPRLSVPEPRAGYFCPPFRATRRAKLTARKNFLEAPPPTPPPPSHPVQLLWQDIRRLHHKVRTFLGPFYRGSQLVV